MENGQGDVSTDIVYDQSVEHTLLSELPARTPYLNATFECIVSRIKLSTVLSRNSSVLMTDRKAVKEQRSKGVSFTTSFYLYSRKQGETFDYLQWFASQVHCAVECSRVWAIWDVGLVDDPINSRSPSMGSVGWISRRMERTNRASSLSNSFKEASARSPLSGFKLEETTYAWASKRWQISQRIEPNKTIKRLPRLNKTSL